MSAKKDDEERKDCCRYCGEWIDIEGLRVIQGKTIRFRMCSRCGSVDRI